MESRTIDDSYLRATHSARIERMKTIVPAERREPNTVSHVRMSNSINNNDNEITPSHSNRNKNNYSYYYTWSTPSRKTKNNVLDFKSRNLFVDDNSNVNETRNDLLYKSSLDDEEYIDNEDDIFNFSRINKKNSENTPHLQKLNKEINNYIKRKTPLNIESDLSSNGLSYSNSIFTTPLAKQTAEKFGMKINDDSNKKRRFSSSSFNIIKANLYVTPKKTTERINILNDGSKSVNYISKMDYNFSINDSIKNNETIFNSPSNKKNTEVIIIDDNKNANTNEVTVIEERNNDMEKSNDMEKEKENKINENNQDSNSNKISIQLKTPQKSSITLTNSSNKENPKKSILDMDFKSLTPNKPTVTFNSYKTPTGSSGQTNISITPSSQNKKRLFHDSLLTRKSYSANPTRIQNIINKSIRSLTTKRHNLYSSSSKKSSILESNNSLKSSSNKIGTTYLTTSNKKSNINSNITYLSSETPTPIPTNLNITNSKETTTTTTKTTSSSLSKTQKSTLKVNSSNDINSIFNDDQPEMSPKISNSNKKSTHSAIRDIDKKYEFMNDKITPIKQTISKSSNNISSSPIITTTTVTKKLGNITKIGVPAKDITDSIESRKSRRHSRSSRRSSMNKNIKVQKRQGVLTELKRKVDPITGIISELSVVEDPDTGETTRVITSYDPVTGNKTETKTITTTTTTMTTTTQSTTTRKTTTIEKEEEEEEEEFADDESDINEIIEYSSSLYDEEEDHDNIFTKLKDIQDVEGQEDSDYHSIQDNHDITDKKTDSEETERTPQNKTFLKEKNRKLGAYSVPSLHSKKFKLNQPFSLDNPPYTIYSKDRSDQERNSFNNIPTVGKLSLSNVDLNLPQYNSKDILSKYSITKNKLDLSTLKKQYKLEQELNDNLLNNKKPKSKIAECEEAIGNLLSKWSKEEEEKNEAEEENADESFSYNTNIKEIREEIQRRIEKNKKLNEEINQQSLKLNLENQKETEGEKQSITITIDDDDDDKKEDSNNDIDKFVKDTTKLKPVSQQLPDFIFSSNKNTPSRISSHEILSSKKSSQLIQRLQDDFIKSHKHTRSPGIDFSSYRLSSKKPRLEVNDTKTTEKTESFPVDQYDDNPFMPNNKSLSIIIDDTESEQDHESKSESRSTLESLSQSVVLNENNSENSSSSFSNNNINTSTDLNKNIPIEKITPKKSWENNDISRTPNPKRTPKNDEQLKSWENDDATQTPKPRRTPKKDEQLESIKKKLSQHSLYVKELKEGIRNKINKSKQVSNNLNHQTKESKEKEKVDTIDIKKAIVEIMNKTPKRSKLSHLDSNRMNIDEDETIVDNDNNSGIDDGDNDNNNDNNPFTTIKEVKEGNIEEIEIIENDEEKKKEEINEEDNEEEDNDDVYIINLDKSPNKLPENKTPSTTPYKTPNRSKNHNNLLQVQNNYITFENSPLSTRKSVNFLSQSPYQKISNKTATSYGEQEIHTMTTTMDQNPESEMDIDIISVGGSSNHSFHQEETGERGGEPLSMSREVTPEVEDPSQSITSVELNPGDTDDDTILFSSGYSTPTRVPTIEEGKVIKKGEKDDLKTIQQLLNRATTPRRPIEAMTKHSNPPIIYNLEEEDEEVNKEEDKENSNSNHTNTHFKATTTKLNSEIQSLFSDRTLLTRDFEDSSLLNKKDTPVHTIDDDDDVIIIDDIHINKERGSEFGKD